MILRAFLATVTAVIITAPVRIAAETSPAPPLRIMTWNINHGTGADENQHLARIAEVIRAHKADVVMLQDVDKQCARTSSQDQAAELSRLTGLQAVFAKTRDHDGGESGIAILTRFTPGESKITKLPQGVEPRILLTTPVMTPGGPVLLACTMLDAGDASRRLAQAQVVSSILLEFSQPVILGGDFNDTPGTPVLTVFAQAPWSPVPRQKGTNSTQPGRPEKETDHIFLRGLRAAEPAILITEVNASSHFPLVAHASHPE